MDPKGSQRFLHGVLDARDLGEDDSVLGSVAITDLFPGAGDVSLVGALYSASGSATRSLLELGSLAYMARSMNPAHVFEIGTYIGRTTRLLAANASGARVFTLDLPQDRVAHQVGCEYRETAEAPRIQQLHGDSRSFDFSPWHGQCDLVWVDGAHDYASVRSDTEAACRLCRPEGWVAWHDYRHTAWWSGVTRAVRESARRFRPLHHVRGTTIAIGRYPG